MADQPKDYFKIIQDADSITVFEDAQIIEIDDLNLNAMILDYKIIFDFRNRITIRQQKSKNTWEIVPLETPVPWKDALVIAQNMPSPQQREQAIYDAQFRETLYSNLPPILKSFNEGKS